MNARDHYIYDDRDNCPLCNRSVETCRCSDREVEEYQDEMERERNERHYYEGGEGLHW